MPVKHAECDRCGNKLNFGSAWQFLDVAIDDRIMLTVAQAAKERR
jgi:hypothetical protein